MAFDTAAFRRQKYVERTAEVSVPELAEFFGDGEPPVFVVRGLTGIELAQAMEAAQSSQSRAALAEALIDGGDKDRVSALLDSFGLGDAVPDELRKYHELIVRGTVEPKLDRSVSVLLAERFPVDHKTLALTILRLTGQGQSAKKKQSDSLPEVTSSSP